MTLQTGNTIFFLLLTSSALSQTDSANFSFSGYGELYYGFDFSRPFNHEKASFFYNYKRHNEINLNLAYIKAAYQSSRIRANLALMTGNYAHYNLASEDEMSRFIFEANAGVRLSGKKDLWLDAGIMPSHIGFETAVGLECWNLTRSILAENSPYYETGIRLSYVGAKEKLHCSLSLLNGWQRIRKPDGIQKPSAGFQISYKTNDIVINYSNFFGSDKPDSLHALRTYHNFYLIYGAEKKYGVIIGFDIGTDKKINRSFGKWFSPVIIAKYKLSEKLILAERVEYFSDIDQIIISTGTPNGFQVLGFSSNLDYYILKKLLWRVELRTLLSRDKIFPRDNISRSNNQYFTTAVCLGL